MRLPSSSFLFLAAVALSSPLLRAQVVLNEAVASNLASLQAADGEFPDWIEIANLGAAPADLSGWGLSDDPADPFQWVFPPGTVLDPGEHRVVFASGEGPRFAANDWDTILDRGDSWRYWSATREPPPLWKDPGVDDSIVPLGPSGFGFGDGDDATPVTSDTVYIRTTFSLSQADLDELETVLLHVDFDDAFVAYLNGVEVARSGIGLAGQPTPWDADPFFSHEAELYRGGQPDLFVLDGWRDLLVAGDNVLALQGHNGANSDDLTLIPFLTLGRTTATPSGTLSPWLDLAAGELHASFKIGSEGETLILTDARGVEVDRLDTGRLYVDTSVGRDATGQGVYYFADPTPGAPNTEPGRTGFAEAPVVSPGPGALTLPVTVSISARSPTASIYYSLDGSEPGPDNGTLYTGPFQVTSDNGLPAVPLRARVYDAGYWPGPVTTVTWLTTPTPSNLPVWSMVADPEDLFGPGGLYNNIFSEREVPMHFEFFETDGGFQVSLDGGTSLVGFGSLFNPQLTHRIVARGGYGQSEIVYSFFPESGVEEYRRLVLRNAGNDWTQAHMRDAVAHEICEGMNLDRQQYKPCIGLINGEYWGIYNLRERSDKFYAETYHGVDADDLDIVEASLLQVSATEGDIQALQGLMDFVESNSLRNPANYAVAESQVDVEEFQNYMIVEIFAGNTDWLWNNVKFWRPREEGGKWRWFLFDLDFAWSGEGDPVDVNVLADATASNGPWPMTDLFIAMLQNDEFRTSFINRYADYLNTRFHPDATVPVLQSMMDAVDEEIPSHFARWGKPVTLWTTQTSIIQSWLEQRPDICRDQVRAEFGLGANYSLSLDVDPPGSGSIRLTGATVDGPFTGLYYLGVPVTLTAVPAPGWSFLGWSDPSLPQETTVTVDPAGNYAVTAQFQSGGSGGETLVVNEINYNSSPAFDPGDWVEIYNAGSADADLSGWQLRDEQDTNLFLLPSGTVVPAGGYLVLASDLASFQAAFPGVPALGDLGFGFGAGGDEVRLFEADGTLHDRVSYDDQAPWPPEPDGNGPTLELINPTLDNDDPGSWGAARGNGTPGAQNSIFQ